MRKFLVLTFVLLISAAWMVAQQDSTSRTAPGNSSQAPSQASPSQAAPPVAPSQSAPETTAPAGQAPSTPPGAMSQSPAVDHTVTEGCLGGSAPNFTLTDKGGTTYKLDIPKEADTTPLSKHVGESVQVMGAVNNPSGASSPSASATAAPGAAAATAGSQPSIAVMRIGRGTGNCGAGATGAKPPGK